ncbi:uncharacterized protein ACJ7VT_017573 [Polymixia lowei]
MSVNNRRFSLDSSVSLNGVGNLNGWKGHKVSKRARRSQSLEEAQREMRELGRTLNNGNSLRDQIIEEESLDRLDGLITRHSFVKHNKTFHKLFQDIPDGENLTHTFTCALQKEVLYHGKLFVSDRYVCFHSSVLLKETKVVIPASSMREVKKQKSALSMLSIYTVDEEKYSFVSLRNREVCYKRLQSVCLQTQHGGSANSSPHVSSAENEADQGTHSSYSSLDECGDHSWSRNTSISLDNDFPQLYNGDPRRCSSTLQGSITDEGDKDKESAPPLMWNFTEKIESVFFLRENICFYIYLLLIVLLVLTSGYIGLRITALEERLNSLGDLTEFSFHHREKLEEVLNSKQFAGK